MINQVGSPNKSGVYAAFETRNAVFPAIIRNGVPLNLAEEKEKKSKRLGLKIAIAALVVGFGVLGVAKWVPKSFKNKLGEYYRSVEDKINRSENKNLTKTRALYLLALKRIRSVGVFINGFYNTAPLKDILVKKSFSKVTILDKFSIWITSVFERVSVNTSKRAYKETGLKFNELLTLQKEITNKIPVANTVGGSSNAHFSGQRVEQKCEQINKNFHTHFSPESQMCRVKYVKDDLNSLDGIGIAEKIWKSTYRNKDFLKDKNTYSVFLPEKFAKQVKDRLNADVIGKKDSIVKDLKDVLVTYKNSLPEAEYLKIEKQTNKVIKSLEHSTDLEVDKLFDKLRDLQIGAAPFDSLSVLSSLLVIPIGLIHAEDKQERVSVSLKYGIPAVGAVAISLYCTMGLVSGGTALLLGTIAGLAINKVGSYIDKQIKKRNLV